MTQFGGIDCDVHPALPGLPALLPYLEPYWREQVTVRGIDGLDLSAYPLGAPVSARPDWRPAEGKPGADFATLRRHVLDGFGSRLAILHCLYGVAGLFNRHLAAALATAVNDWIAQEWLDREPRFRASIVVAPHNPERAAEEIALRADDPRFVQVLLLAAGDAPLGQPQYWPILAAAERHGLPLGIHAGSTMRHATSSNGWPSYHLEDVVLRSHPFQADLLSLIHEGAFAKFPRLRVVLIESGFTWLPNFMWRANKTWRGVRAEVPWVDRPPADLIREHIRITLQPGDAPPDAASMERVLDQIACDDMLLFATDYPHWHFDGDDPFPPGIPERLRRKILIDNPLATYPNLQEVMA
ncbi:MAG TPA: amidohydrolase family protein [Acetobacteraceae bacterium]|nr:amidohydrolase family protein [Acetobacteraceae bacterium]